MYVNAVGVPKSKQLLPLVSVPHGTLRGLGGISLQGGPNAFGLGGLPSWWPYAAVIGGSLLLGMMLQPKLAKAKRKLKRRAKTSGFPVQKVALVGLAGAGAYFLYNTIKNSNSSLVTA
jgi:hypothetical protein